MKRYFSIIVVICVSFVLMSCLRSDGKFVEHDKSSHDSHRSVNSITPPHPPLNSITPPHPPLDVVFNDEAKEAAKEIGKPVQDISDAKELSFVSDYIISPDKQNVICLLHRNISECTLGIWKLTREEFAEFTCDKGWVSITKKPLRTIKVKVKDEHTGLKQKTFYKLPPLGKGFYVVAISLGGDFPKDHSLTRMPIIASDIVFANIMDYSGNVRCFVMDALTGKPINNASINLYRQNDVRPSTEKFNLSDKKTYKTGDNGFAYVDEVGRDFLVASNGKGSEVCYLGPVPYCSNREAEDMLRFIGCSKAQTYIFTDKSLYKAGQNIHFKAVCVKYDNATNKYAVMPSARQNIIFKDALGTEIEKKTVTTNEFGSVFGVFKAPADRLLGEMRIETHPILGSCAINVERFESPNFFVTFENPKEVARLNEKVTLIGQASNYNGSAVTGAKVLYKVESRVDIPDKYIPRTTVAVPPSPPNIIANGTTLCDDKGQFSISFKASGDDRLYEPVFRYIISAEVTSSIGETISAQHTISIDPKENSQDSVKLVCDTWQTSAEPIKFDISATTANGLPLKTSGKIEIYSLKKPLNRVFSTSHDYGRNCVETYDMDHILKNWDYKTIVKSLNFQTNEKGISQMTFSLPCGAYRAKLVSEDKHSSLGTSEFSFIVIDENSDRAIADVPYYFAVNKDKIKKGETFKAVWGSGLSDGYAYVELFKNGRLLNSPYWTKSGQERLTFPVTELHKGGFTLRVFTVKDNQFYMSCKKIEVPYYDKELKVHVSSKRTKLKPNEDGKVIVKIRDYKDSVIPVEVLAVIYDKSIDGIKSHAWKNLSDFFIKERFMHANLFVNYSVSPRDWFREGGQGFISYLPEKDSASRKGVVKCALASSRDNSEGDPNAKNMTRRDFSETVFFRPSLKTDKDGCVNIEFKMPHSLTTWRFMALAHGKNMENGFDHTQIITQKTLMVQASLPRFAREGDILSFPLNVTNMSNKTMKSEAKITFFDPLTNKDLNERLGHKGYAKTIEILPGQSKSVFWSVKIPTGIKKIAYRASAFSPSESDSEEDSFPILPSSIVVTESIPLWINGKGTKKFTFENIKNNNTARTKFLSVQMVSNPMYYTVLDLPFLMDVRYRSNVEKLSSDIFTQAFSLGIIKANPEILKTIKVLKKKQSLELLSNLEKNQDLKNVPLLQTAWGKHAQIESESIRNIANLFDEKLVSSTLSDSLKVLCINQLADGSWASGYGDRNASVTNSILLSFGQFNSLGAKSGIDTTSILSLSGVDIKAMISKAIAYSDCAFSSDYKELANNSTSLQHSHLLYHVYDYLYMRSFYLKEYPLSKDAKRAVDFYFGRGERYFTSAPNISHAHLAIIFHRFGFKEQAKGLAESMMRSVIKSEEVGIYSVLPAPHKSDIETQIALIEMCDEVLNSKKSVVECQKWLLKQKQTGIWGTRSATNLAVCSLLVNNKNAFKKKLVKVKIGGMNVESNKVTKGIPFYEKRFSGKKIKHNMGNITITKQDDGIAWGGVYWQYLEDISKIKASGTEALNVKKEIYLQEDTKSGATLKDIRELKRALKLGELLEVKLEVKADRNFKYVRLSDQIASCTKPIGGLGTPWAPLASCHKAIGDASTNFDISYYIDALPKGTHVFKYQLRVTHKGNYQSGIASAVCFCAPEFSSHSESFGLRVQ